MKGVLEIQGIDSKLELQNKDEVVYFQNFHIFISSWCAPKPETTCSILNSAIVNTRSKSQKGGGGVSAKSKNIYQKILRFFLPKVGVSSNPKGFYQIFWHNLPKNGGFI